MITVFTNGCFDLLHVGHVRLLQFAREQGDRLIVGLNSDESVRRIKGPGRPIVPQEDREEILLALRCVDSVVVFGDDTPLGIIKHLSPDVLVKGPDYLGRPVVGGEYVLSCGGRIVIPEWPVETSTTSILKGLKL